MDHTWVVGPSGKNVHSKERRPAERRSTSGGLVVQAVAAQPFRRLFLAGYNDGWVRAER